MSNGWGGGTAVPVLVLSIAHGEEVRGHVSQAGWKLHSARRVAGSSIAAAIVDLRDPLIEVEILTARMSSSNCPIIALYSRKTTRLLPHLAALGVRHFLKLPFNTDELNAVLLAASGMASVKSQLTPRDSLTGLAPASDLRGWLGEHLADNKVSLLLVNIARFDAINAGLGREAGDAALRSVARRIEPFVAELDASEHLLARMPGAEFAIAVSGDVSGERLHLLAEAIVEAIARPMTMREGAVKLGCRIAIVRQREDDRTSAGLIRRATRVLGEIRDEESGMIQLAWGDEADANELSRSLHADLRAALAKGEIEVLFQPQVAISGGRVEGVEALARWRHPVRGVIGAATLFAVADQSDYLVELSAHIQQHALETASAWPNTLGHLRLAINVTGADLARPRFFKALQAKIDASGFPKERLTIEITESSLMQNLDAAAKVLSHFRSIGCRVAIDDFGTGYSSLAWLKALPADYLKLDQGLAGEILGNERDAVVLKGVIAMARSLGLTVIAEGVESEGQLQLLAREGCALYQGFLCAPALSVSELETLVASRS